MNEQFEKLWTDYLEGDLDESRIAELNQMLAENDELRQLAADLYEEHRLLGMDLQPFDTEGLVADVLAQVTTDRDQFVSRITRSLDDPSGKASAHSAESRKPPWLGYVAVAAATLLISLSVQWFLSSEPSPSSTHGDGPGLATVPDYIATLVRAEGCQWGDPDTAPVEGNRLVPGKLRLRSGVAVVRFDGGASAVLNGNCEFRLDSAGAATLVSGDVTIRAPEEAAGFMLRTPTSDVIDLGTEFSVSVEESGATEVHVAEGEIEWHRPGVARERGEIVNEGKAVRFEAGKNAQVKEIPLMARRFAQLVPSVVERSRVGELTAYDGFVYEMQNSVSNHAEADGGTGWRSHWYRGWPASDQVLDFEPGRNLSGPPMFAPPQGGCLEFPFELGLEKNFREASKRRMLKPFDLNKNGVHYVSFLLRRESKSPGGDDEWFRFMLVAGENRKTRLGFGVLSDRRPIVYNTNGNATSSDRIAADTTYLFVAKIVSGHKRHDQAFLKVYGPQDTIDLTEPFDWTVSGRMVDHDVKLNEIHLYNGPDRAYWADEVRLGTSWEAVTPLVKVRR